MIVSAEPGEIWFAEADTPVGPWVTRAESCRTTITTFTTRPSILSSIRTADAGFISRAPTPRVSQGRRKKTPRYDYNQIMYRLALDDSRLNLPVPVYRVNDAGRKRAT